MPIKNKEKRNAYMRQYMIKRYQERRDEAIEKLGGMCIECKSEHDLHFHHKNPSEKSFTLAKGSSVSQERWDREIDKCILLCGKCHTTEHKSKAKCGTPQRYWRGCRCDMCKEAYALYQRQYRMSR